MIMEPIGVTARFDEHGTITPLNFTWKRGTYQVDSTGRRWLDEMGQHILVMVSSGHIYELTFKSGEGRWYIGQALPKRTIV
jgi:hypothetical protein